MKKTLICLLLSAVMLVCLVPFGAAAASSRLMDGAGLLTDVEAGTLAGRLDALSEQYGFDFLVVTVNTMGGKDEQNYADDLYDSLGLREDGILLLIDMETRACYESTSGAGIRYFDYHYEDMEDQFVRYLSFGDYYRAFSVFLDEAEGYVADGQAEDAYDRLPLGEKLSYRFRHFPTGLVVISLIIGLIAAAVMTSKEKAKLTSVAMQPDASRYIAKDSMRLSTSRDIFLYSTVSRVRIESDSSRSGGSHSSSHSSSSGHSHGGHGTHF